MAAICAFAAGRPVDHYPPMFPADDAEAADALSRRHDFSILGLARDSMSLDIFGDLQRLGGVDALLRARGALLAYHAALKQMVPDVAVMLFVTSMEALISPRHEWGKQKVTQRFVKSLIELCPDAVDSVAEHRNVEEAFGYRRRGGIARRRKELLDAIYQARSLPTHSGIGLSPTGLIVLASSESMRVALLSDLTRAALLAFLQAPRSSLVGHPVIDPPQVQPPPTS